MTKTVSQRGNQPLQTNNNKTEAAKAASVINYEVGT